MWGILNSVFFQTIIILLVGLFAFVNLSYKNHLHLKNSAQLLIFEIKEIEKQISDFRNVFRDATFYFAQPFTNDINWKKTRIYFVSIFDQDEYRLISELFSLALDLETEREILKRQINTTFLTKTKALQEETLKIASENIDLENSIYIEITKKYAEKVYLDNPDYIADLPKQNIGFLLSSYKNVSTSSAGEKLKKISESKFLNYFE